MTRPQITVTEKVKNVLMPFNGLYNSFIGTELESQCENYETEYDYSKYYMDYNKELVNGYNNHLIGLLNADYGVTIVISGSDYEPMNMQNRGDNSWLDIDVDTLPSIESASDTLGLSVDEIWQAMQRLAITRLTSCSGFTSFYDSDMTTLKSQDFKNWDSVYISIYINILCVNLGCVYQDNDNYVSDIEQSYLDELGSTGGVIELLMGIMSADDLECFNESMNH